MRMSDPRANSSERGRTTATNVSLDSKLVAEARELGVNISRASACGLQLAVRDARTRRWLRDNEQALRASNDFVQAHGLPLDRFRQF